MAALTAYAISAFFTSGGEGNMQVTGWPDFYAFNVNGMWYLALIIIDLPAFLLGVIERLPHRTR